MPPFSSIGRSALPLVATAIHAGHDLRPEVAAAIALDDAQRLREEDPFTDRLTSAGGIPVVVHRSRFEVDINRPREAAVYTSPESAWGLDVWRDQPSDGLVERSLALYDRFYEDLAVVLDELALQGPFLVLDLHSYNHRRDGAGRPAAPPAENPEINVGTGSVDRDRWEPVVEGFMGALAEQTVAGHRLDVRENVRFRGGNLSRWVNERYDGTGVALAIECKKVFMDEWTGELDEAHLDQLAEALGLAVPVALGRLAVAVP
ncbi:MAG: N-formylglutamate amidohydrolase [Actinomycetota bacterium]